MHSSDCLLPLMCRFFFSSFPNDRVVNALCLRVPGLILCCCCNDKVCDSKAWLPFSACSSCGVNPSASAY